MPRLHPTACKRITALFRAVMSLPPEGQDAFFSHLDAEVERAESARRHARSQEVRIIGVVPDDADGTTGEADRRFYHKMPLTATFAAVGWVMMALLNAWHAGYFYTLRDIYFQFRM